MSKLWLGSVLGVLTSFFLRLPLALEVCPSSIGSGVKSKMAALKQVCGQWAWHVRWGVFKALFEDVIGALRYFKREKKNNEWSWFGIPSTTYLPSTTWLLPFSPEWIQMRWSPPWTCTCPLTYGHRNLPVRGIGLCDAFLLDCNM